MRKDSPHPATSPDDSPTEGRPDMLRSRAARFVPALVWVLVFGTSAAVASLSWWLVPPYLALMGVLLFEPAGRRVNATNPAGPTSVSSGAHAPADASDAVDDGGSNVPDPSAEGSSPAAAATATRARRGTKGRSKKSRTVAEPAPATWVQVAPGKFVRVEPGSPLAGLDPRTDRPERPDADSGPHDPPPERAVEPSHPESTPLEPPFAEGETRDDPSDAPSHPFEAPDDLADRTPADAAGASRPADEAATAEAEGDPPDAPTPAPFDAPEDPGRPGDEPVASEAGSHAESLTSESDDREGDEPDRPGGFAGGTAEESETGQVWAEAEVCQGDEPERTDADASDEPADDAEVGGDESGRDGDVRDEAGRGSPAVESGYFRRIFVPAQDLGHGAPPSRRNVRSDRADRPPTGVRRRSPRGGGRQRHLLRAFPPRSPPDRGAAIS